MIRLLIECTYVFHHPEMNSGIQRVVRNIIKHLPAIQEEVVCIPIIFQHGKVLEVKKLAPEYTRGLRAWTQRLLQKTAQKLVQIRNRYWLIHARLLRYWPWSGVHNVRRVTFVMCRLVSMSFVLPLWIIEWWLEKMAEEPRASVLQCHAGDVLVLLDSSWHADFFSTAEQLQARGVSIVSVIYDLIPLTHPQFCDGPLVQVFNTWFDWIGRTADGFMTISNVICDEVKSEVQRRFGSGLVDRRWFDFFHLGSELDQVDAKQTVRRRVEQLFAGGRSVYLMVSTIEPRKNHAYLLDAFESLWVEGADIVLCFVGRIGWKSDRLITRIKHHAELNRHLFMLNDLSDNELEYCYRHARSLVFPSFVEGFGLPLVEAMQRGLRVMTSDIPVFHEIGRDFIAYFDLSEPESLCRHIRQFENSGMFPALQDVAAWSWLSWEDTTRQLIQRIVNQIQHKKQLG